MILNIGLSNNSPFMWLNRFPLKIFIFYAIAAAAQRLNFAGQCSAMSPKRLHITLIFHGKTHHADLIYYIHHAAWLTAIVIYNECFSDLKNFQV